MWVTLQNTQFLESGGWRRRGGALAVVLGLHLALGALLLARTGVVVLPAPPLVMRVVFERPRVPPPPPVVVVARMAPPAFALPVPEVRVVVPAAPTRAISVPRRAAQAGVGGDAGSGLDLGIGGGEATGGAGARAGIGDFEAEVKRRILARRRQPVLAWDRRNTCVVGYTVRVGAGGALAGFSIDPCAVPEINEAARQAIREAAPYPAPPALGGGPAVVHGTLVFRP